MDGINIRQDPVSYRRLVNFAEAEPLYPDFITGHELISFYQDTRKAASAQIDMLINLFKMHHFLKTPIGTYSSGMVKKLSLLLAFIGRPSWMLLDEPLATLDEGSVQVLPELISAYHKEFRTGFIFSSHQSFTLTGHDRPFHSDSRPESHCIFHKVQPVQSLHRKRTVLKTSARTIN